MKNILTLSVLAAAAMMALTGCQPADPPLTSEPPAFAPPPVTKFYPPRVFNYSRDEKSAEQAKYDENVTSINLKVIDPKGDSINDLDIRDLVVKENGVNVTPFTLVKTKQQTTSEIAEIVFVVDVTGTMVELIESAKRRLHEFIASSRAKGYHTRMCFSTFGDYTVTKCGSFYDNNPNDPNTKAQVESLLNELTKIKALRGEGLDPGYPDLDENPMRALIDATKAPWTTGSQRFVILVTDWGFLYRANAEGLPDNPGVAKDPSHPLFARNNVPRYSEVMDAIQSSGVKVFAVARTTHSQFGQSYKWDGYNTPFQGQPSIVEASKGEFFNFDTVLKDPKKLAEIFEHILKHIDSTYKLTYIADKVQGLNPALPLGKRNVELTSPRGKVQKESELDSSQPNGHDEPKVSWDLSPSAIQPGSMQVYVDGSKAPLSEAEFNVSGGKITFRAPPHPGAKLRFSFYYNDPDKNFKYEPITVDGFVNAQNAVVKLNDKVARREDLIFARNLEGQTTIALAPSAFGSADPYDIRRNHGLQISVNAEKR